MAKAEHMVIRLTPREFALIVALREKYRFGHVTLLLRDGVVQRLEAVEDFKDVGIGNDVLPQLIAETVPDGEVTIITKGGKPFRLRRVMSFDYL